MSEDYQVFLPSKATVKVGTYEDKTSGYGDCKIFRIDKKTGKEYLYKTIAVEDMPKVEASENYNSRNVGKNQKFNCKDCGVEGSRRMPTKILCDTCYKRRYRARARRTSKEHWEKYKGVPRDCQT